MANDANAPIAAIAIRSDNTRFLTMYSPGSLRTRRPAEWKPSCECNQAQARGASLISRIRRCATTANGSGRQSTGAHHNCVGLLVQPRLGVGVWGGLFFD